MQWITNTTRSRCHRRYRMIVIELLEAIFIDGVTGPFFLINFLYLFMRASSIRLNIHIFDSLSVSPFYFLFQFFISSSSFPHRFLFPLLLSFSFLSVLLFPSFLSPVAPLHSRDRFFLSSFHLLLRLSLSLFDSHLYRRKCVRQSQTHILITNSRSRGLLPCCVVTPNPIFRSNGELRRTRWSLRTRESHKILADCANARRKLAREPAGNFGSSSLASLIICQLLSSIRLSIDGSG